MQLKCVLCFQFLDISQNDGFRLEIKYLSNAYASDILPLPFFKLKKLKHLYLFFAFSTFCFCCYF